MRTAIVLPVKSFERAKSRIAPAIEGPDRAALAEAMVGDVLAALRPLTASCDLIVVTSEPRARELARGAGALVVADRIEAGHVPAARLGVDAARARGAQRVLLVPGDCPALDPDEVGALLSAATSAPAEVVIVPDRHGTGTNALLLTPPGVIAPAFGPGSCERHAALGRAAGASVRVAALESLALDVDAPEDLAPLAAALAERPDAAPRTRAALAQLLPLGAA